MKRNSSGQALLIILLVMAVALTIGLSVVSRSITDIRISQEQEESARAFSAAEAGLESLLATGGAPGSVGDFTIDTDIEPLGNSSTFVFPKEISAGDTQTVWLVDHLDEDTLGTDFYSGTDIELYWGNEDTADDQETTPALEAIIIYKEGGEYKTRRAAFDPKSDRTATSDFTLVYKGNYSLGEDKFSFKAKFSDDDDADFPSGAEIYALRLKFLYNIKANGGVAHLLGVQGIGPGNTNRLPLQGTCYASTAFSETTGISRKVEQCQFYPSLSGIFDYVLFSESSL